MLKRRTKGFIHAVEGVMASLLLMMYLGSMFPSDSQTAEWSASTLKQAGGEYLESFNRANLSHLIFENKQNAVLGISKYFFPASSISIVSASLPKANIRVGIASEAGRAYVLKFRNHFNNKTCWNMYRIETEFGCVRNNSNIFGVDAVLLDTDAGKFNGKLDYDSVFIDFDDNKNYSGIAEGPFFENSIFSSMSGTVYSVSRVDNASEYVEIWNASYLMDFRSKVLPTAINERNINFTFFDADLNNSMSQFDVVVIAGPMNLSGYETSLKAFLQSGKGVVEVADITNANYNAAQKSIFGLEKVDGLNYSVVKNSGAITLSQNISLPEPAGVTEYFTGTAMRVNTSIAGIAGYDVSALPNPANVLLGIFNTTAESLTIAIAQNAGVYDSLYIDSDGDKNFSKPSSDLRAYGAGSTFGTLENTYVVKDIDRSGRYAEIRPTRNHVFSGILNPLNISASGGKTAVQADGYYSVSDNAIGFVFSIALSSSPILGIERTLPAGEHKYGTITKQISRISLAEYNISATNNSASYNLLNIDLNNDGKYNGTGEGYFPSGDIVKIGPEYYRITIPSDGSKVSFRLIGHDSIAQSVINYKYLGRTAWMPDILGRESDAWNYIRAAIIWASDKKMRSEGFRTTGTMVSLKRVFVSDRDIYLPYEAEMIIGLQ